MQTEVIKVAYKYAVVKKSYGYVVINKDLDTHAHLPNYKGCMILIKLINKNVSIKDPYLRRAKERLIPVKRKKKDRYYNRSREQRRAMGQC